MRTASLTALSRTGGLAPDLTVLTRRPMDPELRERTTADSLDIRHETTDQTMG